MVERQTAADEKQMGWKRKVIKKVEYNNLE